MFQAQNRETTNSRAYLKSCSVLQDHYDVDRNKTVFHNKTKTKNKNKTETNFFGSEISLVLRPTVSDHITGLLVQTALLALHPDPAYAFYV